MNVPILAAFVSSAALYAGAAGVSIPILIHLLSKRRFRRVRWAAMDFLLEAERENRRRVRIEQLILLGLRCLAMLLVGLLLARWYVPPRGLAAMIGGTVRTDRIVLLDDSFSTGYRSDGTTVFDAAKAATLRLARWLQQTSPGDALTVILASRPEPPVVNSLRLGESGVDDLRSQLDPLKPSERGGCIRAGLVAVRKRLDAQPETVNAAVYVVSDFQSVDWLAAARESAPATPPSPPYVGGAMAGSPLGALTGWPGERRTLRVLLLDVGREGAQNTCVSSFALDQPQAVAGVPARFLAKITNYGRSEANVNSLRVYVGEASQPPVPVPTIEPGQTLGVPVELTFPSPGPASITVELPDDRLVIDNRRHLAVDVQRAIRVLLVTGQGETAAGREEGPVLAVALRPDGPVSSGKEVETIDENALEDANLAAYHVVILANVFRLTETVAAQLERFAQGGGGVVFFLGDQVDPDLYNRLLYRDGTGLLPARLGEPIEASRTEAGYRFVDPDLTHPLLRNFANTDVPFFEGILTRAFVACTPGGVTSRAAVSRPTSRGGGAERAGARVLLSYDDADRHPAVIERGFGRGHVVLFTTTANKEWTNFPDWFTYVAMMQDLVQYTARPGDSSVSQTGVLVGSPITLQLEPGRFEPQATVRTPAFPEEPESTVEARPDGSEGAVQLSWTNTRRSGVYRFRLQEIGGQDVTRIEVVNVDAKESNLGHCDEQSLRESVTGVPVAYVRGGEIIRDDSADAKHEMWPVVLIALVTVLVTESALAWWFGARTG
jgi:hypothetical protein